MPNIRDQPPYLNGKGKQRDVKPSSHLSDAPAEEKQRSRDVWGQYPLEEFPSPPTDGFCHIRQANGEPDTTPDTTQNPPTSFNRPLDPPLMSFTYPPPPHLANDPAWYPTMVADVHRHRAHINSELDLAQAEVAAALADVTLAQIELKSEMDMMQKFIDRVAFVAGKKVMRKLVQSVKWLMEHGEANSDEESEEDQQDTEDEVVRSPSPPLVPENISRKRPFEDEDEIDPEPESCDEEYEVEESLSFFEEPLPGPSVPHTLRRDPFRLRQNSEGEPELYIPNPW